MNCQQEERKQPSAALGEFFHIFTVSLLSLLLPLSFLLLARLSCAQYLLTITSDSARPQFSNDFLISFFLYANPAFLYLLVSTVSVATLVHGLTGKITFISESPSAAYRPRLYTAWIILCTLQVCVGLGIEGSIAAGIGGGASFGESHRSNLLSRVVFFLGLHEIMLLWSRAVVKPVVDDTVYGVAREERWVQRVAMALTVGGLWWWKLRDEVESLVITAEVKAELQMGIGVADFVGWWLYYLTVTIGMVRVVKALIWLGIILLCKRVRRNSAGETCEDEGKV